MAQQLLDLVFQDEGDEHVAFSNKGKLSAFFYKNYFLILIFSTEVALFTRLWTMMCQRVMTLFFSKLLSFGGWVEGW